MANVSSFYGTLYLSTDDKPWTPEGYLLAYDVLMSQDSSGGSYGFTISDEDITADSASFLEACLKDAPEPVFPIWGSGRWSADNNFKSFNKWTKTKDKYQHMSEETYQANRTKLITLMYENGWWFMFEYTDEEGGLGFICKETCTIYAGEVEEESGKKELGFITTTGSFEGFDYNLRNYCEQIEDDRRCHLYYDVMNGLHRFLNISPDKYEEFNDFIVEEELDELFGPYQEIESYEDIPEKVIEKWEEHCRASIKE